MPLANKNEAEVVTAVERRLGRLSEQMRNKLLRAWLDGSKAMVETEKPVDRTVELHEALERIKQLERALGRKTLENELFKEAIDLTRLKT
jgi:transposase